MDSSHTQLSSRVDTISGLVASNYALILEISGVEESLETLKGLSVNIDAFELSLNKFQTDIESSVYISGENIDISGKVISLQSSIELSNIEVSNIEVSNITVADTLTISGIAVYDYLTSLSGSVYTLSGQIHTISGSVDTLSTNYTSLSGQIHTISGSVDTLLTNYTSLSGQIHTISGSVDTLSTNYTTLNSLVTDISDLNFNDISDINTALKDYQHNMLTVKQIADLALFIYQNPNEVSSST